MGDKGIEGKIYKFVSSKKNLFIYVIGQKGIIGITGEKGQKGKRGPVGLKGDKGLDGDIGPIGEKGAEGKVGPQGIAGIKGVSILIINEM